MMLAQKDWQHRTCVQWRMIIPIIQTRKVWRRPGKPVNLHQFVNRGESFTGAGYWFGVKWREKVKQICVVSGKWSCPCPATFDDFIHKFFTVVECYSSVSVCFCGRTISYVIKPIEMIVDALVAGTKLMKSQFVTFASHPLGVQQIFLTVFNVMPLHM